MHAPAPLAITGFPMFLAEAGRATELRLQYGIPACSHELRPPVEADAVAGFRSAMRQHDHREVFRFDTGWEGQVGRHRVAVAGAIGHQLGRSQLALRQRRIFLPDDLGAVGLEVHQEIRTRIGTALCEGYGIASVARVAADVDATAGQGCCHGGLSRLGVGIQPVDTLFEAANANRQQAAVVAVGRGAFHVVVRVLEEQLRAAAIDGDGPQLLAVTAQSADDQHGLAIGT